MLHGDWHTTATPATTLGQQSGAGQLLSGAKILNSNLLGIFSSSPRILLPVYRMWVGNSTPPLNQDWQYKFFFFIIILKQSNNRNEDYRSFVCPPRSGYLPIDSETGWTGKHFSVKRKCFKFCNKKKYIIIFVSLFFLMLKFYNLFLFVLEI